jgi:hypothetical protein
LPVDRSPPRIRDGRSWEGVLAGERNLWCAAVYTAIADRPIVRRLGAWRSVAPGASIDGEPVASFRFERVLLDVDPTGLVSYTAGLPHFPVHVFRVTDPETSTRAMTELTAEILESLG